jgi:SAM-dependent methyltransferase
MVHALEESWRVLKTGGRLVDLRPTSPRWKVEVVSQGSAMVAGEFDDTTRSREDVASNRAVSEILFRRLFYKESIDFFEFEYYWDTVDGMVEHVEYDWLDESTVPEDIVGEARRLFKSINGHAEIRIKRKMIIAMYSKLVD